MTIMWGEASNKVSERVGKEDKSVAKVEGKSEKMYKGRRGKTMLLPTHSTANSILWRGGCNCDKVYVLSTVYRASFTINIALMSRWSVISADYKINVGRDSRPGFPAASKNAL